MTRTLSSNSRSSTQSRKIKLSRWQQHFVLDGFDDPLRIACTGVSAGKSRALAWWIVMQMVRKPGCRVIGIAQTHKALKRVLIREIQVVCNILHITYEYNKSEQELTFSNGSVFFGYSGENPEGMLGLSEIDILCIDEAAYIPEEAYQYASDRMRGGKYEPMVRLISSPQSMAAENWFSSICKNHPECVIRASALDNPFTSKKFKDGLKERYVEGSNIFRQQVLGEIFDFDIASQIVFRSDFVQVKRDRRSSKYWLGADFAGLGADSNAVVVIDDAGVVSWESKIELNTHQKVAQIYDKCVQYKPASSYGDATGGYGQSTIDLLKDKNVTLTGVNFAQKPFAEDMYPNARTELYLELAKEIRSGFWVPDEIRDELLAIQVEINKRGQQSLLPKELAKKILGHSPDLADALALAVYAKNHGGATPDDGISDEKAMDIVNKYRNYFNSGY